MPGGISASLDALNSLKSGRNYLQIESESEKKKKKWNEHKSADTSEWMV